MSPGNFVSGRELRGVRFLVDLAELANSRGCEGSTSLPSCSWQLLLTPPNLPFACLPLTPASAAGTVGAGRAGLALPGWGGYGCFGEVGGEAANGRTWEVLGLGPVCRGLT